MTGLKFGRDSFVRNLARGDILVPFLERYDDWDRSFDFHYEPKGHDDGWHPSGDCLLSVHDLYHKAKGSEREKISPSLQRTFLVGHFWHQVVQDALVAMEFAEPTAIERKGRKGWGLSVQVNDSPGIKGGPPAYTPYHYATGSGDVAPLIVGNWQGIMDIKTMNTRNFATLQKNGTLPDWAADKYRAQINIYMDFFDQERAMILAVNKDNSSFAEIRFERDQPLIDSIYDKWRYVSELLDSGLDWDDEMEMEFK